MSINQIGIGKKNYSLSCNGISYSHLGKGSSVRHRAHTWICFPRDRGRRVKTRLEQFRVTLPQNKIKQHTLLVKHLLEYMRLWIQSPHLTDMNN